MLKNAPMFKDVRGKVYFLTVMDNIKTHLCFIYMEANNILLTCSMQGKSSSLGVGRGRGVAMRGRVSSFSLKSFLFIIYISRRKCLEFKASN